MAKLLSSGDIRHWEEDGLDVLALPVKHGMPCLRGFFADLKTVEGKFGEGVLLKMDVKGVDGKTEQQTWGCPAFLLSALKNTAIGLMVEIYRVPGKRKTEKGEGYAFVVFQLEDESDSVTEADMKAALEAEAKKAAPKAASKPTGQRQR